MAYYNVLENQSNYYYVILNLDTQGHVFLFSMIRSCMSWTHGSSWLEAWTQLMYHWLHWGYTYRKKLNIHL